MLTFHVVRMLLFLPSARFVDNFKDRLNQEQRIHFLMMRTVHKSEKHGVLQSISP